MDRKQVGYVNTKRQVNLGELKRNGRRYCYRLHCLECGETYGSRTVLKRCCPNPWCPLHQGGRWGSGGFQLSPEGQPDPDTVEGRRQQAIGVLAAAIKEDAEQWEDEQHQHAIELLATVLQRAARG